MTKDKSLLEKLKEFAYKKYKDKDLKKDELFDWVFYENGRKVGIYCETQYDRRKKPLYKILTKNADKVIFVVPLGTIMPKYPNVEIVETMVVPSVKITLEIPEETWLKLKKLCKKKYGTVNYTNIKKLIMTGIEWLFRPGIIF